MTIDHELIDNLLKDYKKPEDIIGENGLLKQLTKQLLEWAMAAELTDHVGYEKHDTAGNLTNDGYQSYTYDATGQQTYASGMALTQSYDGDGLRVKKVESGATTYYLRSSVLGGQVISELNDSGGLQRGYVYLGSQPLAIQQNNQVSWVHQDPVTKSQRVTNSSWRSNEHNRSGPVGRRNFQKQQPGVSATPLHELRRDGNGGDEATMRRYTGKWHRFVQPDPYDGSYDLSNPQSFNRYAYVQNDPVNFVDPLGLDPEGTLGGLLGEVAGMGPGTSTVTVTIGSEGFEIETSFPTLAPGVTGIGLTTPQDPVPQPAPSPTPLPNPRHSGACNAVHVTDLDYSKVTDYYKGSHLVTESAKDHIMKNHIDGRPGKSQYETDPPQGRDAMFLQVQMYNAIMFALGTQITTVNKKGNVVGITFVFQFPPIKPHPYYGRTVGAGWIGRDQNGNTTLYNTLHLDPDCKTVRNSYPGKP